MIARHPSIPRTGETELHLMGSLLERHAHRPFYATEKLDGFSMSFGRINGDFVASARDRMIHFNERSPFAAAIHEMTLPEATVNDVIVQAELVGPGIRGNKYGLDRLQLFVFDAVNASGYLSFEQLMTLCLQLQLQPVPLLARDFITDADLCSTLSRASSRLNPATQREGAVFRPMVEASDDFQGRVSFKVFNPAFKP